MRLAGHVACMCGGRGEIKGKFVQTCGAGNLLGCAVCGVRLCCAVCGVRCANLGFEAGADSGCFCVLIAIAKESITVTQTQTQLVFIVYLLMQTASHWCSWTLRYKRCMSRAPTSNGLCMILLNGSVLSLEGRQMMQGRHGNDTCLIFVNEMEIVLFQ
jgi:hypothetical protein